MIKHQKKVTKDFLEINQNIKCNLFSLLQYKRHYLEISV